MWPVYEASSSHSSLRNSHDSATHLKSLQPSLLLAVLLCQPSLQLSLLLLKLILVLAALLHQLALWWIISMCSVKIRHHHAV